MSLLWVDGFEGYTSLGVGEGYNGGTGDHTVTPGRGLLGAALQTSFSSETRLILPPRDTLVFGFAIRIGGIGGPILVLGDVDRTHISMGVNILNEFFFVLGAIGFGPIIITVPTIPRFLAAWRYVEVKLTPHATNGTIVLKVDNVEHLNLTGIQTIVTGGGGDQKYRNFSFQSDNALMDDYYILDTLGPAPWNDFLGDSRMFIIKPNGPHTTNWTPSTGVNNWDLVNEAETDHADYVESTVLGTKDLYEYEDTSLPPGTVIHAIATMTSARRVEEAGPRAIRAHVLSGATEVEGGFHQLSDTWYMEQFILETDPDTGLPWTPAGIDALKAGFEIEV